MLRTLVRSLQYSIGLLVAAIVLTSPCAAEQPATEKSISAEKSPGDSSDRQAKLESALSKMLSNATLEGSFTSTGAGNDSGKLAREKYTLGEVKKLAGDMWQIPARIQYGGKDATLPIVLPIRWAGDTPVVTVDDLPLPGFGTVSARVMFYKNHYAGYWKHGDHGGNMFGVIRPADNKDDGKPKSDAPSGGNVPAEK